jgi:hypothetical protein
VNDEELGAAFAEALRALVSDVEPTEQLKTWVRTELRPESAQPSRRTRWSPRRRVLAILTPTAAAAAAAVALFAGAQAAPSFAVRQEPGGYVQVTVNNIEGVSGANAKLRKLGVRKIVVVPIRTGCKSHVQLMFTGFGTHQRIPAIGIATREIPAHMIDVLAAKQISPGIIALGIGRVRGAAPSCVAPVKSGVGIPPTPRTGP